MIDFEAWQRHHSQQTGSSRFPVFAKLKWGKSYSLSLAAFVIHSLACSCFHFPIYCNLRVIWIVVLIYCKRETAVMKLSCLFTVYTRLQISRTSWTRSNKRCRLSLICWISRSALFCRLQCFHYCYRLQWFWKILHCCWKCSWCWHCPYYIATDFPQDWYKWYVLVIFVRVNITISLTLMYVF